MLPEGDVVDPAFGQADYMQVRQLQPGCPAQQLLKGTLGIIVAKVIERVVRADAHADPAGTVHRGHGLQGLQDKTAAILDTAPVLVIALVGTGG